MLANERPPKNYMGRGHTSIVADIATTRLTEVSRAGGYRLFKLRSNRRGDQIGP